MADRVDPATRRRNMQRIHARDTAPELAVRSALHRMGYRFSLYHHDLHGKPDIVLARWQTVVLVHGCFWHGHRCSRSHTPRSRQEYWGPKITRNKARDRRALRLLRADGWKVFVIWECQTSDRQSLTARLLKRLPPRGPRKSG